MHQPKAGQGISHRLFFTSNRHCLPCACTVRPPLPLEPALQLPQETSAAQRRRLSTRPASQNPFACAASAQIHRMELNLVRIASITAPKFSFTCTGGLAN